MATTRSSRGQGGWTYAYNSIGTLASRSDAKQQTISYAYDSLDRLTGKSGTGLSVSYNYDEAAAGNGKGRRTSMGDGAGTASYQYDARGRLTELTRVVNGASYTLGTTYDEQDRAVSVALQTNTDWSVGSGPGD